MGRRPSPDLERRPHSREPKTKFVVFCEGAKTEPSYFSAVREVCGNSLIEVETKAAAGVPLTLVKAACSYAKHKKSGRLKRAPDSFEDRDEVWAVFDRDEHPGFEAAVDMCLANAVGVARSNPCFEVWLIQHEIDYDKFDNRKEVQAYLKKLRPEYNPKKGKTPDCLCLVNRVEEAEARAEAQLARREQEGAPYGIPSTTVGKLTKAIRMASIASSLKSNRR